MSTPTETPGFLKLPVELLLNIAEQLPLSRFVSLLATSRQTYNALVGTRDLHKLAVELSLAPPDIAWRSPLHYAAATNSVSLLAIILEGCTQLAGPAKTTDAINCIDSTMITPLLSAIATSSSRPPDTRAQTVELLLRYGAKPNFQDRNSNGSSGCQVAPPLLFAVRLGDHAVLQLLLDAGADPGVTTGSVGEYIHLPHSLWGAILMENERAVEMILRSVKIADEKTWKIPMQYVVDHVGNMDEVYRAWLGEERWHSREKGRYELRDGRGVSDRVHLEFLPLSSWNHGLEKLLQDFALVEEKWKMCRHRWTSTNDWKESTAASWTSGLT